MSTLKQISGKECLKILCNKFGFVVKRQRGSHVVLRKETPEGAYGPYNPEMLKKIPRDKLPKEELKPRMMLMMSLSNGLELPVKIASVNDKEVSLDVNHPLAGKTLILGLK